MRPAAVGVVVATATAAVGRVLAALALVLGAGLASGAPGEPGVFLTIDAVSLAEPLRPPEGLGFVSGRALAHEGEVELFDVVFLIDVSGSTARASGADVDGDGRASRWLRKDGDTILAAELAAVESLLRDFDARTTRVGVVTFSGSQHRGGDQAWVEVELTTRYEKVRSGLEEILLSGPEGATNMWAGLRIARLELRSRDPGQKRRRAQRHVVMLTDGFPEVSYESTERSTQRATQMAQRMGREGIRVHTYAIGPDANDRPRAAVEIASHSGGRFTAVRDPRDLERMLGEVSLAAIDVLRVRNLTNDRAAVEQLHSPDGRYSALVPVREGENTIETYARTNEGIERRVTRVEAFGLRELAQRERADLARLLQIHASRPTPAGEASRELEVRPEEE